MGSFNSTNNYLTICFCWYVFDTEHKDSWIYSIFCCISRYFTVALGNDWWNKARATLYINHFQKTKIYQLNFILSVDFNHIWSWSLTKCLTDFWTTSGKHFGYFQFICSVDFRFLTNIQTKNQDLGPTPKTRPSRSPSVVCTGGQSSFCFAKVRRSVSLLWCKVCRSCWILIPRGSIHVTTVLSREKTHISHLAKRKIIFKHTLGKGYVSSQEQYVYLLIYHKNQPSHRSVNIPFCPMLWYGYTNFFVGQSKVKSTHAHHLWGFLKQVAVSKQGPKNLSGSKEKRWENVRCNKKWRHKRIQIDGSKSDDYSASNNGVNDQWYEKQNGKKDNDNDNVR